MSETVTAWQAGYATLADLWCSPQDVDLADTRARAEGLRDELRPLDPAAAEALDRFLRHPVSEEEYLDLFELDPRCPLYLGSHSFDEPSSCAGAGVSDRNGYMIELLGIYRHLGLTPSGTELPDYLPLMIEFLSLTAGIDDPVRTRLIREYILPYLPPFRARLEALDSGYRFLVDTMEGVFSLDTGPRPPEDSDA